MLVTRFSRTREVGLFVGPFGLQTLYFFLLFDALPSNDEYRRHITAPNRKHTFINEVAVEYANLNRRLRKLLAVDICAIDADSCQSYHWDDALSRQRNNRLNVVLPDPFQP